MPVEAEPIIAKDPRNTLRLIHSPREEGQRQSRNVVTMDGVPDPKPDKRGPGTYGGYKPSVIMPDPNPDTSWKQTVLQIKKPRNPILVTPRDEEAWRLELLARPRPRNPLFEGD